MKNLVKNYAKVIASLIIILFMAACEEESNDNFNAEKLSMHPFIGTWVDTVNALPSGYYIYELQFFENSTFSLKDRAFGIYNDQEIDELSGWVERTGNYTVNDNKIDFLSKKTSGWDSFYDGEPEVLVEDQIIFENCSFTIDNDILELSYTTYPTDAPEVTQRHYRRAN